MDKVYRNKSLFYFTRFLQDVVQTLRKKRLKKIEKKLGGTHLSFVKVLIFQIYTINVFG